MGQPLPMPDHLSMKKFFLKSTLNLFWHTLRLLPLVLSFVSWEAEPPLALLSCQGVLESEKVSPEPLFSRLSLSSSLSCSSEDSPSRPSPAMLPSLDPLQPLNVLLELRGSELDTGLEVWPHQCQAQGDNPFFPPSSFLGT